LEILFPAAPGRVAGLTGSYCKGPGGYVSRISSRKERDFILSLIYNRIRKKLMRRMFIWI